MFQNTKNFPFSIFNFPLIINKKIPCDNSQGVGLPDRIRTGDLQSRSLLHYPTVLRIVIHLILPTEYRAFPVPLAFAQVR